MSFALRTTGLIVLAVCIMLGAARANAQSSAQPTPGLSNLRFNGLIQGWYLASTGDVVDTFRLRRSELKVSADVASFARWTIMIDPSKSLSLNKDVAIVDGKPVVADASINQAGRILQDAYITLRASPALEMSVGQMKLPLGLEGLVSSAALQTVERALFMSDRSRGGSLGDVREVGAMLRGRPAECVEFTIGVFNGTGQTQSDLSRSGRKAVAGRATFGLPWLRGVRVGTSIARGLSGGEAARQDRTGYDVEYGSPRVTLRAEWMAGLDGVVPRRGFYAHGAYRAWPKVEVMMRFDSFDPDTRSDAAPAIVRERDVAGGVNYLISGQAVKWQLDIVRKTFRDGIAPSRTLGLANLQVSW